MIKVLMVGPGREVMGGISTVVNSYYTLGLNQKVKLTYIASMEDGSKLKKLIVAIRSFIKFSIYLKDYDIVHIHMAAQASFYRKSWFVKRAKAAGKIIIHQHAGTFDKFFLDEVNDKQREKIKEIFLMADKLIVLSEEWKDFFAENVCDKDKIIIMHNGIVLPSYHKKNYSDHNVLFLGKIGKQKGIYDIFEAVPQILKKVPDAMFYLGGYGEIEQSQKVIDEKGLTNHVKLLGWIRAEEKEKYLKACSVFILPSYHEGMPMSVLEAMGYGLATISTNAGGIPQIITDGVDGYRVEAGDVGAIAAKLILLLSDEGLKQRIGQAGRATIEAGFDARKNVGALVDIYRNL